MRYLGQAQGVAQFGQLGQQLGDAAVVGLEELPEHQDGEELRLGVVLATELAGLRRQSLMSGREGFPGERQRGLRQRTAWVVRHGSPSPNRISPIP